MDDRNSSTKLEERGLAASGKPHAEGIGTGRFSRADEAVGTERSLRALVVQIGASDTFLAVRDSRRGDDASWAA